MPEPARETPPEAFAAPSDCNGDPHVYAHEHGPHSPVFVGRCMVCGAIDWPGLIADAARVAEQARAEERARIAADLRRAAEGRRQCTRRLPVDHGARELLHDEAACYEAAARIAEDPSALLDVLPVWMWTKEDRDCDG